MPYKVIAKAENFVEDQKFIGHFANVTFQKIGMFMLVKKYCLKLLLNILLESHKSSGGGTKKLVKMYFSQLDIMTAMKLFEIYKVDFEMFGYKPDVYFEFTKSLLM